MLKAKNGGPDDTVAATDELSKTQTGEGRVLEPTTAEYLHGGSGMASGSRRPTPPPAPTPAPPTLSQAEEGSARSETGEQCRNAMAKANLKVGGRAAVFGSAVLLGWVCLLDGDTFSLLLAFATFLSGKALILLSMSMLGLPESLVSSGQRVASKFLLVVCITLSGMTLVSLYLVLLPGRFNPYIGLAVVTVVLLLVAPVHCYVRRGAEGGG